MYYLKIHNNIVPDHFPSGLEWENHLKWWILSPANCAAHPANYAAHPAKCATHPATAAVRSTQVARKNLCLWNHNYESKMLF